MRMASQSDTALTTLREQGIARLSELMAAGVRQQTVTRLVESGRIVRLARGLYQLPDAEIQAEHGLAEACKRVPKGVVCLLSALQYHGLTVQLPSMIWMAIEQGARTPRILYPPMKFVRFGKAALTSGVEGHVIEGVPVRITDPAATIADCFRFRSKVGLDVALEGMREALKRNLCKPDAIMQAAQQRRIWSKLRPYLEAMTADAG
ncbi:MAG: AbiEi antitoxin N-terminal domain-containing protein [Alphaproteobacteria bacterium]|nr:AbiEi antitoxin N-terminal domain-containing protein [Alphaproteobacteria bacterium]